MSFILIIGAKSDIAKATAREYAKHGYDLYLAARNSSELEEFASDVTVRSQRTVKVVELDILDLKSHENFYEQLEEQPLGVISAIGYLGDQEKAQLDIDEAQLIMATNYTGVVNLFNIIANDFECRRSGFMVGISSVAGERGRKSNYIYGASKAGFSAYMAGLSHRFYNTDITVLTVKPGFVYTKMTQDLDLPAKLTATPDDVALAIKKGVDKNKGVIYVKPVWRLIMLIIKLLPGFIFNRTNL